MKKLFSRNTFIAILLFICVVETAAQSRRGNVIDIGSRRELFLDDYLIQRLSGNAELRMHYPQPREIVIVHDEPWEGSGSGYHSIFHDGTKYRMYYKAWQHEASSDLSNDHPLFCAYAESEDGITWTKPKLGLYEFNGSKDNNIVFISGKTANSGDFTVDAGHPAVFKDENPNVSPDALYKAILVAKGGLVAYKSPDGIHWALLSNKQIITDGAFDSQNLAFWDNDRKEYRAYWRYFSRGTEQSRYVGTRGIRTATSKDFVNWTHQEDLQYMDSPEEQLYTNQIKPYHRAPHLLIGFPARYIDRDWSESMRALPELEERELRASKSKRYGTALTESVIMVSRDGTLFKRWNEAFLRPGIERKGTWTYGDQYIGWHLVETKSSIAGDGPNELSLYATENYWKGRGSALRRYTLRLDGFVSVNAPMSGGELVTKPIKFEGKNLFINFSTSAAGSIQAEIQDANGKPIRGYSLADCLPIFGDTIERSVQWNGGSDVSKLAGKTVRLRFVMKDADLYAIQFK